MTKKDYKIIARIFKDGKIQSDGRSLSSDDILDWLIKEMIFTFNTDNPLFDENKFRKEIYGQKLSPKSA